MATFQQAGDFSVVPVDGKMVKNGGNVVSYFCTPDGRLVHAVGGPVDAQRLLEEARWASKTYELLKTDKTRSKADMLREAHQLAAQQTSSQSGNAVSWSGRNTWEQRRLHQMLSQYAYLPMARVENTLFRSLSGEKFEIDRSAVQGAAKTFEIAEKRNRPVLLVLASHSPTRFGNSAPDRPGTIGYQLKNYQTRKHLRRFSVVQIPKLQLAAFTNLKELTGWDKLESSNNGWHYGDTCLLVDPSGEILSQLNLGSSHDFPDQLESALETWKERSNTKKAVSKTS